MRAALPLAALLLVACQREQARPAPSPQPTRPQLVQTIECPNGDGRVFVIDAPDRLGIERSTCMVHATERGSSIACTASRIDPDTN